MFYAHVKCQYCNTFILSRSKYYHYKSESCKKIRQEQGNYINFMDRMNHAMEIIRDSNKSLNDFGDFWNNYRETYLDNNDDADSDYSHEILKRAKIFASL